MTTSDGRKKREANPSANQEAIKILLEMRDNLINIQLDRELFINQYEALTKAIKSLEG